MTAPIRPVRSDDPLEQLKALRTQSAPSDDPLEQLKQLRGATTTSTTPSEPATDPRARVKSAIDQRAIASSFTPQSTLATPASYERRLEQPNKPLIQNPDLNAAVQSATFGFSDELLGGVRALGDETYADAVAKERRGLREFREQHPARAFIDEIGGSVASGAGMVGAARKLGLGVAGRVAPTMLARLRGAAGAGAAAGAATGAGSAEGGLAERATGAAKGAAVGAAFGTGLGVAGEGVRRVAQTRIGESVRDAAARKLSQAFARDELTVDELLQRATQFSDDKPAVVLDVAGPNTRRLARAVRTQPSKGSAQLDEMLHTRAAGAEERTIGDVIATTGLGGRANAFAKADELIAQRRANAKPLYEKAYKGPEIDDPEVLATLELPEFQEAYRRGARIANIERVKLPPLTKTENIGGETVTSLVPQPVQSIDYIKRGVDAVIERGIDGNAMSRTEARALRGRLSELLERVDELNPDYKAARAQFAGDSHLADAFDQGRALFKAHPDEIALAVAKMTPGEQELFRRGALESLGDRIESRAAGRDPAAIADKTLDRRRIRMLFPDDASFDAFKQRLGDEATMHRTKLALQGNSQTADKLAELADMADIPIDALMAAATGNAAGAVSKIAKSALAERIKARMQGITQAKADALATRMIAGAGGRDELTTMLRDVRDRVSDADAVRAARGNRVTAGTSSASQSTGRAAALSRSPEPSTIVTPTSTPSDRDEDARRRRLATLLADRRRP